MISFQKYTELNGISPRTLYYKIERGELLKLNTDNGPMILTDGEITDHKAIESIKQAKREEWNRLILQVSQKLQSGTADKVEANGFKESVFAQIIAEVKHWDLRGVKISGYSLKSLYRKISTGKVHREVRCDKNTYTNSLLASESTQRKVLAVAWHLYGKPSAALNYRLMVDKVKDFARQREEFYELAAIPDSTMYRFLQNEFESLALDTAHQFMNHYNLYKQTRARNKGAFTSDVKFMDYIIGDDHKADLDKVLVWDEVKKEYRREKVQGWYWIEGKTQKVLSYVLTYKDITAEDVKLSLLEALQNYGKPNIAVMVDNGVGKSAAVQDFCLKAGVPMEFSKPYEPTHKSTVERIFGYIKNEFDVYEENYTGSNHPVEGRHRTSKLSPEEAQVTYTEYSRKLHEYLTGFFETRDRQRVIDNKKIKISIRDFFDAYWRNYTKVEIEPRVLRFAYSFGKVKRYNNGATITINKQVYNYMPSADLSPVFNGKPYEFRYIPNDMNRVDMYATCTIIDRQTGWAVNKGDYVCTLDSFGLYTESQRKARIAETNRKITKHLKAAADALIDVNIASAVTNEGRVIDNRKRTKKEVFSQIKQAMPLEKIETIIVKNSDVKVLKDGKPVSAPMVETEDIKVTDDAWAELE